ncbi:unnamed protein product [Parascedosporium putredinis]|uniref:PalH-domain-containing protein n=1 Tax=Parascedosporium putredinis TaxID=1442378 RepID=A0A9P1MFT7_9PEZI|nr:unnamed protein product [Parascedosporium putredinis]CAI8003078.1 unnamed protein product [Parascedosporium putredinis]
MAESFTLAATTASLAVRRYHWGVQDAHRLQIAVMDSTSLKVIRLLSDTFLWLAQAQTLIRLFQRQREKIIIKWAAFALITLDVIFSALNSFQNSNPTNQGSTRPQSFVEAIPALSYLFQLSLGLLYAAWVIYYAILKKRYAFYHPLMKNMPLVAAISLFSILVPVVFFIIDISKPEFAGWGDYVRWVGAAAASVVVWEWVERIEALEREEKKDGILGRQVFDGDDMVEASASSDSAWSRKLKKHDSEGTGGDGTGRGSGPLLSTRGSIIAHRRRWGEGSSSRTGRGRGKLAAPMWPAHPPPVATPISRTDTASAASTVYAVRYQQASEGTPEPGAVGPSAGGVPLRTTVLSPSGSSDVSHAISGSESTGPVAEANANRATLFHRGEGQSTGTQGDVEAPEPVHRHRREDLTRFDWRSKLEDFAATQAEKFRDRIRPPTDADNMRVTVIPAPPRRALPWSNSWKRRNAAAKKLT